MKPINIYISITNLLSRLISHLKVEIIPSELSFSGDAYV